MRLFASVLTLLGAGGSAPLVSAYSNHCDPTMPFNSTVTISSDRNASQHLGSADCMGCVYTGLYSGTAIGNQFAFVPNTLLPLVPGNLTAAPGFYTLGIPAFTGQCLSRAASDAQSPFLRTHCSPGSANQAFFSIHCEVCEGGGNLDWGVGCQIRWTESSTRVTECLASDGTAGIGGLSVRPCETNPRAQRWTITPTR